MNEKKADLAGRAWTALARFGPTAYRGALVAFIASAFAIPLALVATPFVEFLNGMAAQPKGLAQGQYGRVFGQAFQVEREPVRGSIPEETSAYPFEGADHARAKLEAAIPGNPVPMTVENLRRGRVVYDTYCRPCHGDLGLGDGPVVGPNRFPAPPSLHTDGAKGFPDGRIFHLVTYGKGKMPAYGSRIPPADRWAAVGYVRVLQRALDPKPEDLAEAGLPAEPAGSPDAGREG